MLLGNPNLTTAKDELYRTQHQDTKVYSEGAQLHFHNDGKDPGLAEVLGNKA